MFPASGDAYTRSSGLTKSAGTGVFQELLLLMEYREADGRYLVTRKVHWQAVYRVLVDEGWYDASLGLRADEDGGAGATGADGGGRKIGEKLRDLETLYIFAVLK